MVLINVHILRRGVYFDRPLTKQVFLAEQWLWFASRTLGPTAWLLNCSAWCLQGEDYDKVSLTYNGVNSYRELSPENDGVLSAVTEKLKKIVMNSRIL